MTWASRRRRAGGEMQVRATGIDEADQHLVDVDAGFLLVGEQRLGLPDESYYRDEKFAEVREKYAAYLTRMFELAGWAYDVRWPSSARLARSKERTAWTRSCCAPIWMRCT